MYTRMRSKECVRVLLCVLLCKTRVSVAYHLKELAYTANYLKYVNDA